MLKPEQLRAALFNAIPVLQQNPERLRLGIANGRVISTLAPSLSFEYRYQLNLALDGPSADDDRVMVAVLACCAATNQTFLPIRTSVKMIFRFRGI